jgi:hypothetical protein
VENSQIHPDDALAVVAVINMTAPQTVVTIGFEEQGFAGRFLAVAPKGCHIYTFEDSFLPERVEFPVEFAFLNGGRELNLNQAAFKSLLPCLTANVTLAVCKPLTGDLEAADRFILWIAKTYSAFKTLCLQSAARPGGVTLFQRESRPSLS